MEPPLFFHAPKIVHWISILKHVSSDQLTVVICYTKGMILTSYIGNLTSHYKDPGFLWTNQCNGIQQWFWIFERCLFDFTSFFEFFFVPNSPQEYVSLKSVQVCFKREENWGTWICSGQTCSTFEKSCSCYINLLFFLKRVSSKNHDTHTHMAKNIMSFVILQKDLRHSKLGWYMIYIYNYILVIYLRVYQRKINNSST